MFYPFGKQNRYNDNNLCSAKSIIFFNALKTISEYFFVEKQLGEV